MGAREREIRPEWLPRGVRVAGVHCGVKAATQARDLALFVSDGPAVAVGTFTTNRVVAAPVVRTRALVPTDAARAVVVNSGNANACTGEQGMKDAEAMARMTAARIGCAPEQVLVCSTGLIGVPLPMQAIERGIDEAARQLDDSVQSWRDAARAILTTDTTTKVAASGGEGPRVFGLAKGAGMIAPRMATMLAFLFTDARVRDPERLQKVLQAVVSETFNCITVDGHTSTNDTVLLLATGASEQEVDAEALSCGLLTVCTELARQIVADGEGATKLVTVCVEGADSSRDALLAARAIAESLLVKTAIYGCDPNWGRIVSAAGYSGASFQPELVSVRINGVVVYDRGRPVPFDRRALSEAMRQSKEITLQVHLGGGSQRCTFWTCDLTEAYVRFNAEYS